MKDFFRIASVTAVIIVISCHNITGKVKAEYLSDKDSYSTLWKNFVNPPDSTRTKVWWFHGETETTEEGIDADLEAFKKQGVGGVVFYDQVHGKGEGAFPSMSAQWWEALKYAAKKAKQLGLTFEVATGNGYVAGGPWITPALAMKKTGTSDTIIYSDGKPMEIALTPPSEGYINVATVAFPSNPEYRKIPMGFGKTSITTSDTMLLYESAMPLTIRGISYTTQPRGKGSTGSMNVPCLPSDRYCGAKYIDYPPLGSLEYSNDSKTWMVAAPLLPLENNIGHKSRRRTISFPEVTGRYFRLNIHDWQGNDSTYKSIWIDDASLYTYDIVDNLEVKTGLRTEVTYPSATGASKGCVAKSDIINLTGSDDGSGMVKTCLPEGHWRIIRFGYLPTGARTKHGRKNLLGLEADVMSAEAARVHFNHYFKPICDSLASIGAKPKGMCIDSHEAGIQNWTDGFEKELERSLGIRFAEWVPAFAGHIVESREATERFLLEYRMAVANAIADNFYGTLGNLCKENGVDLTSQAMLNICNDNLASRGKASKPQGEFWAYQTDGNYDCLDAASAAHVYGHRIASGEAFTDTPYATTYDELLRLANLAYCRGINEFAVCASSYQPWTDRKYDDSASSHPYVFHRFHPEWKNSGPFWDYQARCAYMLRQGNPVVDIAMYAGEELPVKTFAFKLPPMPEGFNFDLVNYDALSDRITVGADGDIRVKGGMRYKLIAVMPHTLITNKSERELNRLASEGARIVRCDMGESIAEVVRKSGIEPDLNIRSNNLPADKVHFCHRTLGDTHIYFVYNHSDHPFSNDLKMRDADKNIEIWHPTGTSRSAADSVKDSSAPRLNLRPHEAAFIVASSARR